MMSTCRHLKNKNQKSNGNLRVLLWFVAYATHMRHPLELPITSTYEEKHAPDGMSDSECSHM